MKKKSWWPYGISITYGIFLLALIGFLVFSQTLNFDLVSEDYYEEGIQYQENIDRQIRTAKLDTKIFWKYDKGKQNLIFHFNSDSIKGTIYLFRPSDKNLDHRYKINPETGGEQIISTLNLEKGLWRLKILWKKNQIEYYNEGIIVF